MDCRSYRRCRAFSRSVLWNDRFGVTGSERRASFTARVPECDNLEEIASHSIVEEVSNSSDAESQDQPKRRSRAKSFSAEMPSSRSASSRASRSSASCSSGSRAATSSPRARTVTDVPSGSERPSTRTLPPTMIPEAICIREWYPTESEQCILTPNVQGQWRCERLYRAASGGMMGSAIGAHRRRSLTSSSTMPCHPA